MGGLTLAHIKSKRKALSEYYTKNSWLLHNETTYLTDWYASPTMRTNPGNKMTKRTMFLTCQLVNGMNDFRFSQVDFIKLLPTVRTFGKRCYISSIKVSPKQYNIPYKAYACLILKKIRHTFFQAI